MIYLQTSGFCTWISSICKFDLQRFDPEIISLRDLKTRVDYGDGVIMFLSCRLHNFIWLGLGQVESRLSQTVSEKVKKVTRKDRTHDERKPVWLLTTMRALLWATVINFYLE